MGTGSNRRAEVEETDAAIHQDSGPGARIERAIAYRDVVSFWLTDLNLSQVEQIGKLEGVSLLLRLLFDEC